MINKKISRLKTSLILPVTKGFVERRIHMIRGVKVLLDSDLAELYQIETRLLIQAVKRNESRFPSDFLIKLSLDETKSLRSQIEISNKGRGGRRYLPYAFTELGIAMLSSVLNSERAVQMNIYIMRAFVKMREILADNAEIAEKIKKLEKGQNKNTEHILVISSTLNKLMEDGVNQKDAIGFVVPDN